MDRILWQSEGNFKKSIENDRNKIDKISGIKSSFGRIMSKLDTAEERIHKFETVQ